MSANSTTLPYSGPALLHVGYIKTGTTSLQQTVFSNADSGFELVGGDDNRALLVGWFRARNDFNFDAAALRAEVDAYEYPIRQKGKVPVWSEETLLGDPIVTDYCGPEVLWRLVQLNLNVKILITIRRQEAFALSGYREALRFGQVRLTDFIGTGSEDLSMRPVLRPEFLEYDHSVNAYQAAFGKDDCRVLPLEMLSKDPEAYLSSLSEFMGLPPISMSKMGIQNVGRSGTALSVARILNGSYVISPLTFEPCKTRRAVDKILNMINRLAPARLDKRIEAGWQSQISGRYDGRFAQSNRRLEAATGLDLRAFGYQ
jgi:hypothetical protein